MIIEGILEWFLGIVNWLLDLIPVTEIFGGVAPNPQPLINVLDNVSCIMPVGTMLIGLGIWITLANLDLAMAVLNWVIKKIPGVN